MKRAIVIFGLSALALSSNAVVLSPGSTVAVSGTTEALRPELAGTVIVDQLVPYLATNSLFSGMLQERIVRETGSGTLDFYFRIENATGQIENLSTNSFAGFSTDVDWRLDGLGSVPPVKASRSSDGSIINFGFDPAVIGTDESRFFFIKTNAVTYKDGFVSLIDGGSDTIDAFAPAAVPEPASMAALAIGASSLLVRRRRRRS
jgi:hypothetical protein